VSLACLEILIRTPSLMVRLVTDGPFAVVVRKRVFRGGRCEANE